jgi:hypothetical protein
MMALSSDRSRPCIISHVMERMRRDVEREESIVK